MSEEIQDPTGEYKRHHRKLRWLRKSDFWSGVVNATLGLLGLLVSFAALGYLLWTHATAWLSYVTVVCILFYSAFMVYSGRQRIQWGKRAVTPQEVQRAKQRHRQALQEAVQGKLPETFSKSSRRVYLGCTLLFGALAGVTWYLYVAHHAGDIIGYAIAHTIAMTIALLGFLASFGGKAHQQKSAAELRHILQAGECKF